MDEQQVRALMAYIRVGIVILSARVFALLALLMAFGLFAWAMYQPTPERMQLAGGFAALVFLPVLFKTAPHLTDPGA
jgi:hypothetical protein